MDEAREKLRRDARLMSLVAGGDARAKRDLIELLWPRVRGIARHMSPYEQEVEDLSQEALLQVLRAAPRFRADGGLEAWADVIVVRTVLKRLRALHARNRVFESEESAPPLRAVEGAEAMASKERADCVTALLHQLPPLQRLVLVLKLVQGHTVVEVAELVGKSDDAVRYHLKNARANLRGLALSDPVAQELFTRRSR